jgi:D-tyrosyl-tRNA(Tyr) deacylase
MIALVQRVAEASVTIASDIKGEIRNGMLVFLGIKQNDNEDDAKYLAAKSINLRIFADENRKMNLSLLDVSGEMLVISQFTLHADTQRGNRPAFFEAAEPEKAKELYEYYISECKNLLGNRNVQEGAFGSMMKVKLVNDGPVTIILKSKNE